MYIHLHFLLWEDTQNVTTDKLTQQLYRLYNKNRQNNCNHLKIFMIDTMSNDVNELINFAMEHFENDN